MYQVHGRKFHAAQRRHASVGCMSFLLYGFALYRLTGVWYPFGIVIK